MRSVLTLSRHIQPPGSIGCKAQVSRPACQNGDVFSAGVMCASGAHHPSTSTIGASAGPISPVVENVSHTGAGFFLIDKHGWLAGAGSSKIWQSFGGEREGTESPWQTASRELLEETGIPSEHLVSLAPPFFMRKDHHVYVLHIVMIRSTHASSAFPMVTSRELTRFRHFTSFNDAFHSELGDGELVHRRDIEPAFLVIAADIYRAISMRAQAAATTTAPRPALGGPSVGASAAVSSTDDASTSDALLLYPLLRESNYFDHEASGRKHARVLPNRVAREATWIDAVGQHEMNRNSMTVTASESATISHAKWQSRHERVTGSTTSVTDSPLCPTVRR